MKEYLQIMEQSPVILAVRETISRILDQLESKMKQIKDGSTTISGLQTLINAYPFDGNCFVQLNPKEDETTLSGDLEELQKQNLQYISHLTSQLRNYIENILQRCYISQKTYQSQKLKQVNYFQVLKQQISSRQVFEEEVYNKLWQENQQLKQSMEEQKYKFQKLEIKYKQLQQNLKEIILKVVNQTKETFALIDFRNEYKIREEYREDNSEAQVENLIANDQYGTLKNMVKYQMHDLCRKMQRQHLDLEKCIKKINFLNNLVRRVDIEPGGREIVNRIRPFLQVTERE